MDINSFVISILQIIHDLHIDQIDRHLEIRESSASISLDANPLTIIAPDSITVLERNNVADKIANRDIAIQDDAFEKNQLADFFQALKPDLVRLNHIGISYPCPDIEKELNYWHTLTSQTDFALFEEDSGFEAQRWFFLGHKKIWDSPLFEIVLTESKSANLYDEWIPHFQIDLDTSCSIEQLKTLTSKTLRPDFFGWELDVPDLGVVLGMGRLGTIQGTHVYLGLGTNKGNYKYHRQTLLKQVCKR